MMTREEAIQQIEGLFPADAEYEDTAEIGQQLLEQAKREVSGWRTEPTEVLVRYAQLCMNKVREMERTFKNRSWK